MADVTRGSLSTSVCCECYIRSIILCAIDVGIRSFKLLTGGQDGSSLVNPYSVQRGLSELMTRPFGQNGFHAVENSLPEFQSTSKILLFPSAASSREYKRFVQKEYAIVN